MVPTFLYTTAASGGSPTADELATPDPARAEADKAIAAHTFPGCRLVPEPGYELPPILPFHAPKKAD
jgi:hypothetical protein